MTIASASAETSAPSWSLRPSTGSTVFTLTCCPTLRSKCRGSRSARSSPGELTSSSYGRSCSNPSRSSRRDSRWAVAAIVSRSTPPSFLSPPARPSARSSPPARSTVTRRIRRPPSRPKETSHSSSPAASTTGRTRSPTSFSRTPNDPSKEKVGASPLPGDTACVSAAQYTRRCWLRAREPASEGPALPVRCVPVVPRGHPANDSGVVPGSMQPDPQLAAHGLDLLLGLELVPHPQAGHVDEHEVPCPQADVLHDGLDLRSQLDELSKPARRAHLRPS